MKVEYSSLEGAEHNIPTKEQKSLKSWLVLAFFLFAGIVAIHSVISNRTEAITEEQVGVVIGRNSPNVQPVPGRALVGKFFYHGTTLAAAQSIMTNGPRWRPEELTARNLQLDTGFYVTGAYENAQAYANYGPVGSQVAVLEYVLSDEPECRGMMCLDVSQLGSEHWRQDPNDIYDVIYQLGGARGGQNQFVFATARAINCLGQAEIKASWVRPPIKMVEEQEN